MSYAIDPRADLDRDVARIAGEQLDKAVAELREPAVDRHEAIHDVRKRAKKLRALLRLVRNGDASLYKAENGRLRDLARSLSAVRDRTALIEAARDLSQAVGGDAPPLRPVREALERRRDAALAAEGDLDATVDRTVTELDRCAERVAALSLAKPAKKIVARGYGETYKRARRALAVAERSGEAADFHELRKRAKYHMNHLRLLAELWPEALRPLHDAAERVAEDLGRDHDYAVLLAEMDAEPDAFGSEEERAVAVGLIREHSEELRARALAESHRLFAVAPKAARRHVASLWSAAAKAG